MKNNNLAKNTTIYAIGDIIPKLFSLITFPVLTSYITPSEYGIINYVATIDNFASIICLLALSTFYLVYYFKVGDELEKKKLLGCLSIFLFSFNLVLLALFLIFGPLIFSIWNCEVDFYPYIAIGLISVVFNIIPILPSALYRVQERPLPLTILNVLRGALTMIITVVSVVYFEASAFSVLLSRLIVNALFAFIFFVILCKNAVWYFSWIIIKKALKFSLPLVPGSIAYYLYSMFDRVLIEKFLSLKELGIYSTAATIALLLNVVSNGAYKAFEPHFFKIYGNEGFECTFAKVRDSLMFVMFVGCLCLSGFSKEFLLLFSSNEYHYAFQFVPIIVAGAYISGVTQMYTTIITAKEKTKINALITILGAIISITLNSIFLPKFGIWAAASTSAITFLISWFVSVLYARVEISHIRSILISVFVFGCMFIITFLPIESIALSIGLKILLIAVVSLSASYLLHINIKSIFELIIKK